jgi:serine/threonine-protein kinase
MSDLLARVQTAVGDGYRVERELGGGGMSRLFIATERALRRPVVIKILPPQFTSEVSAARFEQEIQVAAQLQHPNILPVLSAGAQNDLLYYIMPYVPGESLRHRLAGNRRLAVAAAVRILEEVADALAYAHSAGVIHRDIKPENILLEAAHAVLTDFGVARALVEAGSGRLTETGVVVGTPAYMSPEQAAGERHVDARADVYALAVVGYEMLAGVLPFEGATARALIAAQLTTTPKPLHALRPDLPPQLAAAIDRGLSKDPDQRYPGAAEFRDALAESGVPTQRRVPRGPALLAAAGVMALLAGAAIFATGSRHRPALDANLVAVAPFDVFDPKLAVWREGLVDIMSRNLDGAGPLHTVSPTLVVRRWQGRGDPASASTLARRTGARLALFGQLVGGREDSVRLTATLLDVGTGRAIADLEVRGQAAGMDRITDSLTVALLRELGKSRPIGAVRLTSLGSSSLPALKAFLQGEQHFRRTEWDSALAFYSRAIEQDSTFALALRRTSLSLGWKTIGTDSLANAYAMRAGAFNHGLPRRDSLLITADSISAVMFRYAADTSYETHERRLFEALQEATRRYPDDPEAWYALGDARYHFGFSTTVNLSSRDMLEPFDRAIALDSAFTPSYIHPVELALALQDSAAARRYATAYLVRAPTDVEGSDIPLSVKLLDPTLAASPEVQALLDTAPAQIVGGARTTFARWADDAETAVRVARVLADRPRPGPPAWSDTTFNRQRLAMQLEFRGHLRDAYATARARFLNVLVPPALFGVVPADTLTAAIARRPWGTTPVPGMLFWWWEARADTPALRRFARSADSIARQQAPLFGRGYWQFLAGWARASEAFARHDTAGALRRFATLSDSLCPNCVHAPLSKARVLVAAHRDPEALPLVERNLPPTLGFERVMYGIEAARLNERLGNRDRAITAYQLVANAWRRADPELRPFVTEARDALARLGREPR